MNAVKSVQAADRMPLTLALMLQSLTLDTPPAQRIDLDRLGPPILTAPSLGHGRRCDTEASDDVLVCTTRANRYRLPINPSRDDPTERVSGEAPNGLTAMTPPTRCGIFAGERSCSKREAAAYGYGNGRDPLTVLGKIVQKVADPN
ncbi:hypothetical protein [uncultured Sphingomonas sp.]|uniref:hypothetical protein n=2 Tax=uncultured Sphingomonas sp. TaxID=158754 RepID=UPI0025EECF92|nr:hypothetical protein [uncultured Sphingomonas sp.]